MWRCGAYEMVSMWSFGASASSRWRMRPGFSLIWSANVRRPNASGVRALQVARQERDAPPSLPSSRVNSLDLSMGSSRTPVTSSKSEECGWLLRSGVRVSAVSCSTRSSPGRVTAAHPAWRSGYVGQHACATALRELRLRACFPVEPQGSRAPLRIAGLSRADNARPLSWRGGCPYSRVRPRLRLKRSTMQCRRWDSNPHGVAPTGF